MAWPRSAALIKKSLQISLLSLLVTQGAQAASDSSLIRDRTLIQATVAVDRQLIPAMIYTAQGDQPRAERAIADFASQWYAFSSAFAIYDGDPEWPGFLDIASSMVRSATTDIRRGQVTDAYLQLEAFLTTVHGLRERNGIIYYLDELNAYKKHLDALIQIAERQSQARFKRSEIRQIQKHWAEVWPRWEVIRRHVSQGELDQELYGFDDARFIALKQAVAQEQDALYQLKYALIRGFDHEIADAIMGLEAGFMRTYRLFGNMPY